MSIFESFVKKYDVLPSYAYKDDSVTWSEQMVHVNRTVAELSRLIKAENAANEADRLFDEYADAAEGESPFGYAFFSPEEKVHIHRSLDAVREAIDQSRLPSRKKNALYRKLANLSLEVDKDGTLTDSFFAFGIDVSMVAAEMEENARPAIEQMKDILRIVFRRRAECEGASLPSPSDIPLLPQG